MGTKLGENKFWITPDGGFAIPLINKTGVNSEKGRLLEIGAIDNSVRLSTATGVDTIGVMYSDGIPDGSEVWVIVAGIAEILLDDDTGVTVGNWCESGEAGYCDATNGSPVAAPQHFREIGHALETAAAGGGGTHQLVKINLHFL